MKGFVLGAILFFVIAVNSVAADEIENDIDDYIAQFNKIAEDYATGKISEEGMVCRWAGAEFLLRHQFRGTVLEREEADELIHFLEERYERGIKSELEAFLEAWTVEGIKTLKDRREIAKSYACLSLKKLLPAEDDDTIVTYYSLDGERPIAIYLTVYVNASTPFYFESYPSRYEPEEEFKRLWDMSYEEQKEKMDECENNAARPVSEEEISSVRAEIERAKDKGADTSNSEQRLKEAVAQFEGGEYLRAIYTARDAQEIAKAEVELREYEQMTKEERREYVLNKINLDMPKEERVEVRVLNDEEIQELKNFGVDNFQFAYVIGDERIYSATTVINLENKTLTTYENRFYGDYDLYIGLDMTFMTELDLLKKTRERSMFEYGKRMGKAILKGDVKVKPFWKIYKVLSAIKATGEFGTDFSAGVMSSLA